ncbi:MAG: pectate lyase, partial [Saprospiraceae bacterium]
MNTLSFKLLSIFVLVIFLYSSCVSLKTEASLSSNEKVNQVWSSDILGQEEAWFASNDAKALANSVLQHQSQQGGWPKNTNLAQLPLTKSDIPAKGEGLANSLDNNATTLPMEFLAKIIIATGQEQYKTSFYRGLDYLFAAQYP